MHSYVHDTRISIQQLIKLCTPQPKGDLSVLLGRVPPYKPPQSPTTGLPSLPIENAHPYHIVVIAGQECPTPSGAPRGLGGGLIKGVTLRHKREIKEKKEKETKEKDKEAKEETIDLEKDIEDVPGTKSPEIGDDDERLRATSPMTPHSPFLHRLSPAAKGWSQMLDDYLCGPNYPHNVPHSLPSSNPTSSRDSPVPPHKPNGQSPLPSPQLSAIPRSSSTPPTPSSPIPIPAPVPASLAKVAAANSSGNISSPHGPSHLKPPPSPLAATSRSSIELGSNAFINSSSDDSEDNDGEDATAAGPSYIGLAGGDNNSNKKLMQQKPKAMSSPSKQKLRRPEIVIPTKETKNDDQGMYVHVAKERLLGMYFSLYVYKGAEHLIQGMSSMSGG